DGYWMFSRQPDRLSFWPAEQTTDGQGRFTFRGMGRGCFVTLEVTDDRFAPQDLHLDTGTKDQPEETALTLAPLRIIEGRITCADTGNRAAHARLEVTAYTGGAPAFINTRVSGHNGGKADEQGRFRIAPYNGDHFTVVARPAEGEPYLIQRKEV